uniref:Uncharacterized protein n=1 Tax=Cannabis sativa TaxID=3483 RepID=A0A803NXX8_CANSA
MVPPHNTRICSFTSNRQYQVHTAHTARSGPQDTHRPNRLSAVNRTAWLLVTWKDHHRAILIPVTHSISDIIINDSSSSSCLNQKP